MTTASSTAPLGAGERWMVLGLWALTLVPAAAGTMRVAQLAQGAAITPENARFFHSPTPVVIHILTTTLYCALGALQFSEGFRRRHPLWHRRMGWVLIPCGLASALTGLWMTWAYPLPEAIQGPLLKGFRTFVGAGMFLSLGLGMQAIAQRDFPRHRAWMVRAYALGIGAGTQVLVLGPFIALGHEALGLTRDLLMILSWGINMAVAEAVVGRVRPQIPR